MSSNDSEGKQKEDQELLDRFKNVNGINPAKSFHQEDAIETEQLSPPIVSGTDHEVFSNLRPSGSREVATYTAAAAARIRSMDEDGNFETDHDPKGRSSIGPSAPSPATLIKNLPDAASKTLNTTIAAPARTIESIKAKLQSPSTDQKSKSDIPHSLDQMEHDLRHNREAPGRLADDASSNTKVAKAPADATPVQVDSPKASKAKQNNSVSGLLQRGHKKTEASPRNSHTPSPRTSALRSRNPRRKGSAIQEDTDEGEDLGPTDEDVEEEEEEDEEVGCRRIIEQERRLEEFDKAQTVGLLRTQQEAGIEPPQSPTLPTTKPAWLVGLPLFGGGSANAKEKQSGDVDGASSRRSSFRGRARRHESEPEDDSRDESGKNQLRRSKSDKVKGTKDGRALARSASVSRAARSRSRGRRDGEYGALRRRHSSSYAPPRRQSTTWTSKLRTKIPIKEFPLQGSGRESEFNQECPLWARQPWKYMYFSYFGLSVGLYHLPRWAISSLIPSHRGRPDWSWKKATMVKLFRHGTQLTFRTRTNLGRDLQKEVPHSKTVRCKFTWVKPVADEDVRGELRRAMLKQKVHPQRTCGFWYGDVAEMAKAKSHRHRHQSDSRRRAHLHRGEDGQRSGSVTSQNTPGQEDGDALVESQASLTRAGSASSGAEEPREALGGVGRPAEPGEKVLYHLHGGAYWIGTAHEKDVTAAVNTESLRYMAEIYKQREAEQTSGSGHASDGSSTSSMSSSATASSPYQGKLLRSFSLDYRLCVPGRPRAGSYPAALLDALSGYLYLTRDLGFKPENVIVAGDSAGGNLALALCRYLRDEGEEIAKMPGALLLMSPWVDVSRSHSGPTSAPNLDSTVYLNQKSDIISSMLAFRNTAVSAFLGSLPARETYRNPYISPVSLQLPLERGGSAPFYGFHGFPKKIYITTGSAEISYDQHLTLAHRLASGTKKGRPTYSGDRLSAGCNAREMAERRNRPRPKEMLDAEQNAISVTPLHELQGIEFAEQVIDGEPRGTESQQQRGHAAKPPPEPEEKEDREVIFDEVKDAVHDYLLFKWFEPERSQTWRRIAKWIDDA